MAAHRVDNPDPDHFDEPDAQPDAVAGAQPDAVAGAQPDAVAGAQPDAVAPPDREAPPQGMIPARARRSLVETFLMRVVATAGIVGIGVAIAAIMHAEKSQGWLIGLVVSTVSVILAAVLWSSRRL